MNYEQMFLNMYPDFFEESGIKKIPTEWVFSELIMDLKSDKPKETTSCPQNITFGEYKGNIEKLKKAVLEVDKDWIQYFGEERRIFCAFDKDEIAAFCLLEEFGKFNNLLIGGPGCVGTVPFYRKKGIGLEMVKRATNILKEEQYDFSWIHYTHLENWYKKLGYKTVLKWNSKGIISKEAGKY